MKRQFNILLLATTFLFTGNIFSLKQEITVIDDTHNQSSAPSDGYSLYCETENQVFNNNAIFELSYVTLGLDNSAISYEYSGLRILSTAKSDKGYNVALKVNSEYAELSLYARIDSEQRIINKVYFGVVGEKTIFCKTSKGGLELAKINYMREAKQIADAVAKSLQNNLFSNSLVKKTSPVRLFSQAIQPAGLVSGKIEWTDNYGAPHPLQYTKVGVYFHRHWTAFNDWIETFTNVDGKYSIQLPYTDIDFGRGIDLKIVAEGANVNVKPDTFPFGAFSASYEHAIDIKSLVQNGVAYDCNLNYSMNPDDDSDFPEALQVLQATINAARYATYLNDGVPLPHCSVLFPSNNTTNYIRLLNLINISYIDSRATATNDYPYPYADWDVIGHEYGHHVETIFEFHDSPGGNHSGHPDLSELYLHGNQEFNVLPHSATEAKTREQNRLGRRDMRLFSRSVLRDSSKTIYKI